MKNKIVLIALIAISVLCFVGCGNVSNGNTFTSLQPMAEVQYSVVERTVVTSIDGDSLVSYFKTTKTNQTTEIEYSFEQLNELSISELPEERKSIKSGKVVLENGSVVKKTGDDLNVDFVAMADLRFGFKDNFFKNAKWSNNSVTAQVVNVEGFMDVPVECESMTATITYSDVLKGVVVNYQTNNGVSVKIIYNFTK